MSTEQDNKIDVATLTSEDLARLNDGQMNYVRELAMERRNPRVYKIVREALKGKEEDVIRSLSQSPYAYTTPVIELNPSLKIEFTSLWSFQSQDVNERTTKFMRGDNISDVAGATYMQKMFLCHGIHKINGEYLGHVQLPFTVSDLSPKEMDEAINTFVSKRMRELNMRPMSLIALLNSANQVFQEWFDSIVNLHGDDQEVSMKTKALVESVGKSTGPQVAGQKPI